MLLPSPFISFPFRRHHDRHRPGQLFNHRVWNVIVLQLWFKSHKSFVIVIIQSPLFSSHHNHLIFNVSVKKPRQKWYLSRLRFHTQQNRSSDIYQMLLNSSSIQTLLSVPEPPRISCFYRFQNIFWNPTSYRLRTIPPVGNRTQPRRTNRCLIVTCKSIRCFCRIASTFAIHICSVFRHTLMLSVLPAQGQPNNITRPTEPVLVSLQPSGQRGYIMS